MDKLKQYVALTVVGCLAVMAAGWFLLVSPKRTEAAELRETAATQVSANKALATQIEVLKAQAKSLPREQAKLAAVAAKIPDSRAMPALIRSLTVAAEDAGVELVSLAPGASALVAPPAAAAPVAKAGADDEGGATKPKAPRAAAPSGAGQLATIPVTLNVVGGYFQVQQFLSNLEELKRAMRFTTVTLVPGANPVKPAPTTPIEDGRSLNATLTGQIFMTANAAAPVAAPVVAPAK
jgi:Tfp pilus assembly protein PilO